MPNFQSIFHDAVAQSGGIYSAKAPEDFADRSVFL